MITNIPAVDERCGTATELALWVSANGAQRTIHARGVLDAATRHQLRRACKAIDHLSVVVDLSQVVFMDCAGYGALVECRQLLERSGHRLSITGDAGQPGDLIRQIESLARPRVV